jgi:hypothetical protein
MKVFLKKVSGRGWGLHFEGQNPDLYEDIKGFIRTNVQWLDAPHSKAVKAASPFIQRDTPNYLFIEFRSDADRFMPVVEILRDEFGFYLEEEK